MASLPTADNSWSHHGGLRAFPFHLACANCDTRLSGTETIFTTPLWIYLCRECFGSSELKIHINGFHWCIEIRESKDSDPNTFIAMRPFTERELREDLELMTRPTAPIGSLENPAFIPNPIGGRSIPIFEFISNSSRPRTRRRLHEEILREMSLHHNHPVDDEANADPPHLEDDPETNGKTKEKKPSKKSKRT